MEHRWIDHKVDSARPPKTRRRRPKSVHSLERDIIKLAVAFFLLSTMLCGAAWLSKRQYEISYDPMLRQVP